jgi:dTDP-4-dehydrorhamnose reductase
MKSGLPRILLTGQNGLLGSHLLWRLDGIFDVFAISRNPEPVSWLKSTSFFAVDIAEPDYLSDFLENSSANIIINCAALSDVDKCEADPELARKINTDPVKVIATFCLKSGCLLIHISTDYLFDGAAGPYDEDAEPNPINSYGRTKLQAEKAVIESGCRHIIVRTNHIYGNLPQGPSKLIRWLLNAKHDSRDILAASDQFNNPTWAGNLADAVIELAGSEYQGIINIGGPDYLSRYAFALIASDIFEIEKHYIKKITLAQTRMAAPRPLLAGLTINRMKSLLRTGPVGILDGLKKVRDGEM